MTPAGAVDLVCLVVAGAVRATLPGPEVTLAWTHSVQKTRWEERYRVDGAALHLVEARVEGSGAGMEAAPDARREGGAWVWRPDRRLDDLVLAASPHGGAYRLCSGTACVDIPLDGSGDLPVTVVPCGGR